MANAGDIDAAMQAMLAAVASGLTLEVTANVIEDTPVDTGHARANWVPGIGQPPTDEVEGTAAQAAGQLAVAAYKIGDGPLNITNNTRYIEPLIGGSSSQAPPGWLDAAIDRAVSTVQAQYEGVRIDISRDGGPELGPRGGVGE